MSTLSVHIRRRPDDLPEIVVSNRIEATASTPAVPWELPTMEQVKAQLTTAELRALKVARQRTYFVTADLWQVIHHVEAISLERWSAAIVAAILKREREQSEGATATAINGNEQMRAAIEQQDLLDKRSPTLMVGDTLYALQPIKRVTARATALSVLRAQLRREAQEELNALKAAAQAEADSLLSQAQSKLNEAEEIKRRAQLETQLIPPFPGVWLTSDSRPPQLGISTNFEIRAFQSGPVNRGGLTGHFIWTLSTPVLTPTMRVWIPRQMDGSYDKTYIRLASEEEHMLPHMSTGSCCVVPQGVPARISRLAEAQTLVLAIRRAFGTVNMGSLLVGPGGWVPAILDACPPQCLALHQRELRADAVNTGTWVPLDAEPEVWRAAGETEFSSL